MMYIKQTILNETKKTEKKRKVALIDNALTDTLNFNFEI